jgi:hypothetical protein
MRQALPESARRWQTIIYPGKIMSREQNFMVTYGLHNFATYTPKYGAHSFFIRGRERQKMIRHAKSLMEGAFGETVNIQVG